MKDTIEGRSKTSLSYAIVEILQKHDLETQEEVCRRLLEQGFKTNQASVSRLLNKLGAVKVNEGGRSIYRLPPEWMVMTPKFALNQLVLNIAHNEQLLVVRTAPGAAQLVARFLDQQKEMGILGTVAGDDTVLIVPEADISIQRLKNQLVKRLVDEGKKTGRSV